jgi:threonine/homoserine/homoserine lactone efflux protein
MPAFWEGVLAGYGIAVPVGAIAVLIVDMGLRRGFRPAFMAGAGAASADFLYASLAALAGGALAARIYAQFLGLTLLNPLTVAYFAALILGRGAGSEVGGAATPVERVAFVAGAARGAWRAGAPPAVARLSHRPQRGRQPGRAGPGRQAVLSAVPA